jgi:hypothetical protein
MAPFDFHIPCQRVASILPTTRVIPLSRTAPGCCRRISQRFSRAGFGLPCTRHFHDSVLREPFSVREETEDV